MRGTASFPNAMQIEGAKKRHPFRRDSAARGSGHHRLNAPGSITSFLQQFAKGGSGRRFAQATRFVSDNPGGKLDGPRMNGNPILLHQQNFLFRGRTDDERDTGPMNPVNVFPMTLFDQRQEFAGMQNYLVVLIHSLFNSHSYSGANHGEIND